MEKKEREKKNSHSYENENSEGCRVIMLLSNPFRPDPRVYKEAISLEKKGHVITIFAWDREKKHLWREVVDGVTIERMGPKSTFSNPLVFAATLPIFWLKVFIRLIKRSEGEKYWDIIHCHDLDTLPPGLLAGKIKQRPVVYDAHEIYSSMVEESIPGLPTRCVRALEKRMVSLPDGVIAVNPRFKDILKSWGARNVAVVMGSPPSSWIEEEWDDIAVEKKRKEISPDNIPIVLYIGVLEPHRNLQELCKGYLKGEGGKSRLVIGGFGTYSKDIEKMASHSGGRIIFLGEVHPKKVPAYTKAADILVAIYDPRYGNNRNSVPNKLFEATAFGKPIIVASGTWTGRIVEDMGCGVAVKYGTGEVFKAINNLIEDREFYEKCSRKGEEAFMRYFRWEIMEERLHGLYKSLLDRR